MELGSREAAGSEFDSIFPQAFRRQSPSTVHGIGETQNKNKSRKIPENSRKFGEIPENPGKSRSRARIHEQTPGTPERSRENKKVGKCNLSIAKSRKIPEDPGRSWKRVYKKIPEISETLGKQRWQFTWQARSFARTDARTLARACTRWQLDTRTHTATRAQGHLDTRARACTFALHACLPARAVT
jgi:hypothetical protein